MAATCTAQPPAFVVEAVALAGRAAGGSSCVGVLAPLSRRAGAPGMVWVI